MKEKINDTFQNGYGKIENLVKGIYPNITERELVLLKRECKSLVGNIIHDIGNNTNSLTFAIEE